MGIRGLKLISVIFRYTKIDKVNKIEGGGY